MKNIESKNVEKKTENISSEEQLNRKIEFFWDYFQENQEKIFNVEKLSKDEADDLFRQLYIRLRLIGDNFGIEMSRERNGKKELIITPNGLVEYFPVTKKIVSKAPKMEKWEVKAFKQRMQGNFGLKIGDKIDVFSEEMFFKISKNSENKLDITVYLKGCENIPKARQREVTYQLLDGLLGEEDVENYVGGIEETDKKDSGFVDSRTFVKEVDKLKGNQK